MKTANYTIDNLGIYDEYKDTKKAYLKEINKTKYNNNLKLFNQILKSVNTSYNTDYTKALKGEHFNLELYLDKITIDEDQIVYPFKSFIKSKNNNGSHNKIKIYMIV